MSSGTGDDSIADSSAGKGQHHACPYTIPKVAAFVPASTCIAPVATATSTTAAAASATPAPGYAMLLPQLLLLLLLLPLQLPLPLTLTPQLPLPLPLLLPLPLPLLVLPQQQQLGSTHVCRRAGSVLYFWEVFWLEIRKTLYFVRFSSTTRLGGGQL